MAEAWIYTQKPGAAEQAGRMLAELGFSPRHVLVNGTLGLRYMTVERCGRRSSRSVLDGGGDADAICTRLRTDEQLGDVPIVASVAADELELGPEMLSAHELIVAPFTTAELSARITRARRAAHGVAEDEVVRSGGLELNLATYQVTVDRRPVEFTYMEYELLKFLMTHPRRAFSRDALLSRVWRYDFFGGARTVDVHVRRVRAKLGTGHAMKLKTVRRVGYRFEL